MKELIRRHNWAHAVKDKGVSHKTMAEREQFLFAFFRELRGNAEKRYRVEPPALGNRHIAFMVRRWLDRGLAPATIRQYLSYLRTFSAWIGKPHLVQPIERYVADPVRRRRRYAAEADQSWDAHGVDAEAIFEAMSRIDRHAAAQLAVKDAFGLRRKEAVMLRPGVQVVSAAQAGIPDARCEQYLELTRGTKGGRRRYVPIDNAPKQQALARALAVLAAPDDHLGHPARTLKQNLRRIDYVMEKLGLTKSLRGVTGHGLRHQYAHERYEALAGAPGPLRGGAPVPRDRDRAARLRVAAELGHGREQISSAYLSGLTKRPTDQDCGDGDEETDNA